MATSHIPYPEADLNTERHRELRRRRKRKKERKKALIREAIRQGKSARKK